jgi:hypothetical protein
MDMDSNILVHWPSSQSTEVMEILRLALDMYDCLERKYCIQSLTKLAHHCLDHVPTANWKIA